MRQKHGDIQNIMQKRCSLHKRAKERKKEGEREKKRDGDRERSGLRRQHKETEVMRGEKGRRRRRRQPHHFISIHASMDKWGCPMNDLVFLFIFCPFLLSFLFFSFLSSYHLVGLRILFFFLFVIMGLPESFISATPHAPLAPFSLIHYIPLSLSLSLFCICTCTHHLLGSKLSCLNTPPLFLHIISIYGQI